MIDDSNRFVLVVSNTKPDQIITVIESIRLALQDITGYIILIERVSASIVNNNGVLVFNYDRFVNN